MRRKRKVADQNRVLPGVQWVKCFRCNGGGVLYIVDGVPVKPGRCCDCGGRGEVRIKGVPMEATL